MTLKKQTTYSSHCSHGCIVQNSYGHVMCQYYKEQVNFSELLD